VLLKILLSLKVTQVIRIYTNKFPNRVAYIDFSRAFDSVPHPKLHKLKSYDIDGILLDWVASFLYGRSHCTKV